MKQTRKHYTPEEKVAILRRHLLEKIPLSELCEEYRIQPTQFYQWQKQFFEKGSAVFERSSFTHSLHAERRIAELEEKLQRKNEVVAELLEEHVHLKKNCGGR